MSLTQCDRIVEALKSSPNGITSTYMIQDMRIYKYSSRIADLRAKGYVIQAQRVKGTLYRYLLISEPGAYKPAPEINIKQAIQEDLGLLESTKKEFRMI